MDDPFDGGGFSTEPITGPEAAKHRHMLNKLTERWPVLEDTSSVVEGIVVVSRMIRIGGPVVLVAAIFGAWSKSQGWF